MPIGIRVGVDWDDDGFGGAGTDDDITADVRGTSPVTIVRGRDQARAPDGIAGKLADNRNRE